MKVKCSYCRAYISDTDEKCPYCGGVNDKLKRTANDVPTTIEELQHWYTAHNLPDEETTRFFIGKDYKEPRAFGIFKNDAGIVTVYKNKSDGTRAIRYQGRDEAYAVNELYLKLKSEIQNQKSSDTNKNKTNAKKATKIFLIFYIVFFVITFAAAMITAIFGTKRGYYKYNDMNYYYVNNSWYYYDDYYNDWFKTTAPEVLRENSKDYYQSYDYDESYGTSDISESTVYDSDWDSSSDWDSGSSWDSGGTDFDSDW